MYLFVIKIRFHFRLDELDKVKYLFPIFRCDFDMTYTLFKKLISLSRKIFFEVVSPKFKTAPLKNLMDYFYVIFEKIGCKIDIITEYYLDMYDEVVDKEINMANISKHDKILVVGGGSIPATSLLISIKTNANVVSIDSDESAVINSQQLIKNKFSKVQLDVIYADAADFPMNTYDHIFVLYGVKNQRELLKKIHDQITQNTTVLLRTTKDSFQKKIGEPFLSDYFSIKQSIDSETIKGSRSMLLVKK